MSSWSAMKNWPGLERMERERHVVTEGVAGMWHYHLSDASNTTRGLCGAQTMRTAIRPQDFGVAFGEHFPKRPTWCEKCKSLAPDAQQASEGKA